MNPKLLLAEEPTGNLQSSQGEECLDVFNRLNTEGTIIVQGTFGKEPDHGNGFIQLPDGWIVNN